MVVEIEIEDVGYVRPINAYQVHRARRVKGPTSSFVWAAFSCGLTIKQFRSLSSEKQQQIFYGHNFMTNSRNTATPGRQGPVSVEQLLRLAEAQKRVA